MKRKYKNLLAKIPGGDALFRFSRNVKDVVRRMLIPTTIFENIGFTYFGPVDGHDTENLITLLRTARDMRRPVLVHVMTQKGKGYTPAEEHPKLFHGVGKFDPVTGRVPEKKSNTFSDAFGSKICELAEKEPRLCAITAAMPGGTGLLDFKKQFPNRMFDVGIAEEHAVSMAGGLAKQGMIPVVALYSTFLQRAYDMVFQDVCMLNQHVVFAIDRAGLVGEDGETHHGVFDVGFLRHIPNMQILCPASTTELQDMLQWAVMSQGGPVAIRYPRGTSGAYDSSAWRWKEPAVCCREGRDCAIVTYGTMVNNAISAAALLKESGVDAAVIRLTQIAPLHTEKIAEALKNFKNIIIVEEACDGAGIYDALAWLLREHLQNCKFSHIDLGHQYVTHGAVADLYSHYGLDPAGIAAHIQEVLKVEN